MKPHSHDSILSFLFILSNSTGKLFSAMSLMSLPT